MGEASMLRSTASRAAERRPSVMGGRARLRVLAAFPVGRNAAPRPRWRETYRRSIRTGNPSLGIAKGTNCTGISYPSRTDTR